ncbi:MAG: SUMF1/EgtB/PvdO family nonheme iron enzyme [Spirochaetes bacterium]|nr:SUMF1/EgtB/PvdO family nonheme iron enzyme [Spirochaetota bacterium]
MKHAIFLFIFAAALSSACGDGLYDAYNALSGSLYAGKKQLFSAGGISFTMVGMPGGATFPTGVDDNGSATVAASYWIGEAEVTFELWNTVCAWAGNPARGTMQYTFASAGAGVGNHYPVTNINWRDCMVWCNALTEWYNAMTGTGYTCVYQASGSPLRNSESAAECDSVVPDAGASGFRLLSSDEWELAARYKGADNTYGAKEMPTASGMFWTPGDYASGATGESGEDELNDPTNAVAWFDRNSSSSIKEVKTKKANALDIYDMSGNVHEWCFDLFDAMNRIRRGGAWNSQSGNLQVGDVFNNEPVTAAATIGFRIARSHR